MNTNSIRVFFKWFFGLLRKYKEITLGLLLVGSFFDILFSAYLSDILFFSLLLLFVFLIKVYQLKTRDVLAFTLIYFVILFIFFIAERDNYHTDRVVTWIFFLLFIYMFQELMNLFRQKYEN